MVEVKPCEKKPITLLLLIRSPIERPWPWRQQVCPTHHLFFPGAPAVVVSMFIKTSVLDGRHPLGSYTANSLYKIASMFASVWWVMVLWPFYLISRGGKFQSLRCMVSAAELLASAISKRRSEGDNIP